MPLGASFDTKQQVKQAVDIVDLVGSYLSLRRAGRGYAALCPWHEDSRPSLQVNPERQSFKCWVCDIGGDVFSFVMKMEGVGFPEALAMLADRAGISLEPVQRGAPPDRRMTSVCCIAPWPGPTSCITSVCSRTRWPPSARAYLERRGITNESLRQFQIGYAPEKWDWLQEHSRGSEFQAAVLERVGSGFAPAERPRLLRPLHGPAAVSDFRRAEPGGRARRPHAADSQPDREVAKYVNSPETPLFSKSNLLYGLDVARDAIRKTNTALVMEGYTDCITAHQFGFSNAVAVLGTALGAGHVQLLRRFAERVRVVLVLDGDEAGQRARRRCWNYSWRPTSICAC